MKYSFHLFAPLAIALAGGCALQKDLGSLETESDGTDAGETAADTGGASMSGPVVSVGDDGSGGADADGDAGDDGGDPPMPSSAIDILFVVDNSGSMGEEQGLLAAPLYELTEPLQQAGVQYRIAVTSTDNGNPWCEGTTPEAGRFVMSSCQSRLDDFTFWGAQMIDAEQVGCMDACGLPTFDIAPTPTHVDPNPAPRPWIEWSSASDLNTPGLAPSMVLSCALPQGINGCGFEQPLESMYKALQRSGNAAETEYGFVRPDANLLVVFVTDETDCSSNPEHESIFLPDGDRAFWSDPSGSAPTSAVCWNSGVQCSGISPYDDCQPADFAPDGSPAANEEDASLLPISRYIGMLQGLQAAKSAGRVRVMAFVGRSSNDGPFVYADAGPADPTFQIDFGIGPGCSTTAGRAVPPVRIRAVANAINDVPDENLFSVCESNYAPALAQMADTIIGWSQ